MTGYSFRTKVKHDACGDLAVIQMKDLEEHYQKIGNQMTMISSSEVPSKYYLEKGDVLFIAKGANNYALVFDEDYRAVAASAFFVLRPSRTQLIPEYLAWFINQNSTQRFLEEKRSGTYIPSVNKKTLMSINLKCPSIEKQKQIAQIVQLSKKEQQIYSRLKESKKLILDTLLQNAIN